MTNLTTERKKVIREVEEIKKIVTVRIVSSELRTYWYFGLIGKTFVCYKERRDYILKADYDKGHNVEWGHIIKDDCVELFGWEAK